MKKLISLLLFLLFVSLSVFSDPVDTNTARLVAKNYLIQQSPGNQMVQSTQLDLAYVCTTTDKAIVTQTDNGTLPLFYIFNVKGNQGFVIVSADNDAIPVLGYSTEGNFRSYDIPVAFDKLLEKYKQEIKYIKFNNLKADENINTLWQENLNGSYRTSLSTNSVSPLIQTKWGQSPYYNDLCPYDNSHSVRTVTGCVATAMAQIMKFWNFPAQGSGFHSYNHSTYGTLSANFGSTTYNWSGMPNSVNSTNNALATLMYQAGVSVDMNYGPASTGGSGAYVILATGNQACAENALKTYFGYATSIQGLDRSNYSDATWIQMLKTDLDAGRPILYTGFGQDGGHAFVCDGYDNSNYFHFNWGWKSNADGYFNINNLNPSTYVSNGQQALLGIKPSTGGSSTPTLQINSNIMVTPNPIQYATSFKVNVDIWNNGNTDFEGEFSAAVFNKQGAFIDYVNIKTGISLPKGYHYTSGLDFSTTGMVSVTPGDYMIAIFYKTTTGNWTIVPAGLYSNAINVTVLGPANDISLYDSIQVSPYPMVKGKTATIHTNIANFGTTDFNGDILITLNKLDGKFVQTLDVKTSLSLGVNKAYTNGLDFNVTSLDSAAGTYIVVVWDKPSGGSWKIVASYTSKDYINPVTTRVIESPILPDAYEVNNIEGDAYNFPVSFSGNSAHITSTGSNIHVGNDIDYYKTVLPSGFNYSISARVHDSYNSGNSNTYTADVVFAYNDGTGWSDSYDDVMSSNIVMNNNGGTLKFAIVPRYSGNTGTYLLDINITKSPNSINEKSENSVLVSFYPNPASSYLNIQFLRNDLSFDHIKIVNALGETVLEQNKPINNKLNRLDISGLLQGLYFLTLSGNQPTINYKFIVVK